MENFHFRAEKKFCRKEGSEILISELSENVNFFFGEGWAALVGLPFYPWGCQNFNSPKERVKILNIDLQTYRGKFRTDAFYGIKPRSSKILIKVLKNFKNSCFIKGVSSKRIANLQIFKILSNIWNLVKCLIKCEKNFGKLARK